MVAMSFLNRSEEATVPSCPLSDTMTCAVVAALRADAIDIADPSRVIHIITRISNGNDIVGRTDQLSGIRSDADTAATGAVCECAPIAVQPLNCRSALPMFWIPFVAKEASKPIAVLSPPTVFA